MRTVRLWVFLVLFWVASAPVFARHRHPAAEDTEPGQFDYYLLSLSWSPSYCLVHPDEGSQCRRRGLGFVLHGLWPQFEDGRYPQFCAPGLELSASAAALGERLFPSPRLVQHEWQRHGSCSGLDPEGYFRTADRALGVLRIPSRFEAPRTNLSMTADEIRAEFLRANASVPSDALRIACGHGELSELRLCLTPDLAPRPCGRGVRNSCPRSPVSVPSVR